MEPDAGLRLTWLNSVADDIRELVNRKKQVIVVSSGSIALGRRILGLDKSALKLEQKQAAAAVGQIELCRVFREVLGQRQLRCGQILVTLDDTEIRRKYLNARATIENLLQMGVVPVVNENDTVATTEIRYGDNDRLSARVATMASADMLIVLSDVDGLYTGPPGGDQPVEFIPNVESITPEIEQMAGGAGSTLGTGGMVTKIKAARIATYGGTRMVIGSGKGLNPISAILSGGRCTVFEAHGSPISARKRWIAGDLAGSGHVTVDAGAAKAIFDGKSLLPIGVLEVFGSFARGDVIGIITAEGQTVAQGMSAYDSGEAVRIMGKPTDRVVDLIGYAGPDNLVHRDDMVVFSETASDSTVLNPGAE